MRWAQAFEDPFRLPHTHGNQEDPLAALGNAVRRRIENSHGNTISSAPQTSHQRIEHMLVLGRGHPDDILEHNVVGVCCRYNLQKVFVQ